MFLLSLHENLGTFQRKHNELPFLKEEIRGNPPKWKAAVRKESRTSTAFCTSLATDGYANFIFRLSLEMKLILTICNFTYEWDGM